MLCERCGAEAGGAAVRGAAGLGRGIAASALELSGGHLSEVEVRVGERDAASANLNLLVSLHLCLAPCCVAEHTRPLQALLQPRTHPRHRPTPRPLSPLNLISPPGHVGQGGSLRRQLQGAHALSALSRVPSLTLSPPAERHGLPSASLSPSSSTRASPPPSRSPSRARADALLGDRRKHGTRRSTRTLRGQRCVLRFSPSLAA